MNETPPAKAKPITGIKTVSFFRDGHGRCCDRCGTFIKNVALVTYKDGITQSYGSECINKILSGDTSLQKLWNTNARWLKRCQEWLEIFNRPSDQMPRGHEYYGSGLYFIADSTGRDICCGWIFKHPHTGQESIQPAHMFWHLDPDWEKNQAGNAYRQTETLEEYRTKSVIEIDRAKEFLAREIERVGAFLARVLAKGLVSKCAVPDCDQPVIVQTQISINNEPKALLPVCKCHLDAANEDKPDNR